jgi:uncharacterized membrane protein YhaH (DUF805 family)
MMLGAIKYGLGNLFNFNGRDARQTFWYYVLFVYIVVTAITMLAMIPMMIGMFSAIFEAAKTGAPEASVNAMMPALMGDMIGSILWLSIGTGVAMVILLAASLVRRLHDSGMSGWWALGPGVIQVIGLAMLPRQLALMQDMFKDMDPAKLNNPATMMQMQGNGLIGWVAIGLVIWFGVRKSTPGPNPYGVEPVRF